MRDNSKARSFGIVAVLMLVLTAGCGSGTASPTSESTTTSKVSAVPVSSLNDVRVAAAEVSLHVARNGSDDLVLAWEDLYRDMLSVLDDLKNGSRSIDTDGFQNRIAGFDERFDMSTDERWSRMIAAIERLLNDRPLTTSNS